MTHLPYVYAALIDILGYREHLYRDERNGSLDFKEVLSASLRCLGEINNALFSYQSISDTIIITCADREKIIDFLQVIKSVQVNFLENGLFVRGGLVYQRHFQSGSITYSPAYTKAYEIEQSQAIYPRIVIDYNIIAMFESTKIAAQLSSAEIICEANGVYFLNIVDEFNWKRLFTKARDIFTADHVEMAKKESIFNKHKWFEDYLMSSRFADSTAMPYIPKPKIWRST